MTGYFIAILTFVSLAVLLGFALNVQWGQAGMLNFGLAGFYGIGAYTAAILSKAGVDGLTATVAAMAGSVRRMIVPNATPRANAKSA